MSMTTTLTSAIRQAFAAMGDLVGPIRVRSHDENYDPNTAILTKTTTEIETTGVVAEYEAADVDGSVIQREDRRIFLLPVDGLEIKIGDEIVDAAGIVYSVQDPKQIKPNEVILLWEVRGRA